MLGRLHRARRHPRLADPAVSPPARAPRRPQRAPPRQLPRRRRRRRANGTNVYPIQSGFVHIRYQGTGDVNVDVGAFDYWHIHPTVREGQYASAYRTKLGWVLYNFKHVAVSEGHGTYLNPLRPGGSLRPYHDSEPPIIGVPRVYADGRVIVGAFDPQSFVEKASFETPVLAPAALAWRVYDRHGRALTPLQWALRGSQNYLPGLKSVIFAPGAANPGYACFAFHVRCIPHWVYWLAGGLTPALPLGSPAARALHAHRVRVGLGREHLRPRRAAHRAARPRRRGADRSARAPLRLPVGPDILARD